MNLNDAFRKASKDWAPETRSAMLAHLRAAAAREELQGRYSNAAELAQAVDPTFRITPAIQMIAEAIEIVLDRPRHNLLVTCPPQEGKSTLCAIWAPLRALQLDSSKKIILATYASGLAEDHSRACRDIISRHGSGVVDELTGMAVEDKLGYQLSPGANKVNSWKLANVRGGMIAVGLEGGATGKSADLLIIDDPYKNMAEADSVTHRRKVDEWMSSVARTRLSPQASMIVIQCMTGDTPVLMANGLEKPLRNVRPGDLVATYEDGVLTTARVCNHANQGSDDVFMIRMKSGRCVRANARHPFLTVENGREIWRKTSELEPGMRLIGTASGTDPARSKDATCRPSAKACAEFTTGGSGGLTGTDHRRATQPVIAHDTSSIATGSPASSTTLSSLNSTRDALSVGVPPTRLDSQDTGKNSALITATQQGSFVDFSVTTAISRLPDWSPPPTRRAVQLRTLSITSDEILEIVPAGREDVFDIEVERTENFIANGLVSHNTRWHPEDLSGKILAGEAVLEPKYRTWKHINIPAIAEAGLPDALGRAPGEVMESARGRTKEEFEATRRAVGERVWFALYQGSPVIPSGGLFMREWFDPHLPEAPASPVAAVVGIDPADTGQGDDTGIIGATLAQDGTIAMIEDWSGKFTADEWSRQAILLALTIGAREIALEAYAAATTYVQVLKRAWRDIHTEAVAKRESGATLTPAEERACAVNMPFTIHKWRARGTGDPVGRSALLRQALETGKCRVVETKMIRLENDAADWQEGQHQPDRVSAAIVAHDRLAELASGRITLAPPVSRASGTAPAWLSRKIG